MSDKKWTKIKDIALKERIIAKYLTSGKINREVADESGFDYRSLHRWAKVDRGRQKNLLKFK